MTGDMDLRRAFRALAETAYPYVRPPGADRAQRTARARVRNRRVAGTLVAALAVLVPATIVALAQRDVQSLPEPPATPAPTSSAAPGGAVPETPRPGPGELANVTLPLSWPDRNDDLNCGGTITFVDGTGSTGSPGPTLRILDTMDFDVDRDGGREIIARISCLIGIPAPTVLVAVEPGQTPVVVGTVLATGSVLGGQLADSDGPEVASIGDYAGLEDGTIRVDVADKGRDGGDPPLWAVAQQRVYGWTGESFQQVAGPTTFAADPAVADLVVTAGVMLGAPAGGIRSGTMTVTIHNNGPQIAVDVSTFIDYRWRVEEPAGGDWSRCPTRSVMWAVCEVGDVAPGQTVSLTLPVQRLSAREGADGEPLSSYGGQIEVRTGNLRYPGVTYRIYAT